MPLEDPNVIDMIAKHDNGLLLVITDSGATTDAEERKARLLAKLSRVGTAQWH